MKDCPNDQTFALVCMSLFCIIPVNSLYSLYHPTCLSSASSSFSSYQVRCSSLPPVGSPMYFASLSLNATNALAIGIYSRTPHFPLHRVLRHPLLFLEFIILQVSTPLLNLPIYNDCVLFFLGTAPVYPSDFGFCQLYCWRALSLLQILGCQDSLLIVTPVSSQSSHFKYIF